MSSHQYLVEMMFAPFTSLLTPHEVVTFTERFVLRTLDACQKLRETGLIVAGGPMLASVGFTFIARAGSPQELEHVVASLPLWTRAQTRVVPLGEFEWRASAVRTRLGEARSRIASSAAPSATN